MKKTLKTSKNYQIATIGWVSRAIAAAAKVFIIPIVLTYLGTQLYAAFVLVIGLDAWFSLVDFGIGDSLQNYISELRAKNIDATTLYSSASVTILIAATLFLIPYAIISYPLQHILFRRIAPNLTQWYILFIIGSLYILKTVFGIAYRVFFAEFRAQWPYIYQALGPVIAVICVFFITKFYSGQNRFFIISTVWVLPILLCAIIGYIHILPIKNIFANCNFSIIKKLITKGLKFWGYYIGTMCILAMDYMIMSQTLTAKDITIYSIIAKIFITVFFVYQSFLAVIWPQLAELFIKKQWSKANKILLQTITIGVSIIIATSIMFIFSRNLVLLILAPNKHLQIPIIAILLFGLYYIVRSWSDTYATAIKSQNHTRIFWLYLPIQAIISTFAMYYLSLNFGLNGIIFGLAISFITTSAWILPTYYFRLKKLTFAK